MKSSGFSYVTGDPVTFYDLTVYPDRGRPKADDKEPHDRGELPKSVSGTIEIGPIATEGALRQFSTLRRVVWPGRYA